MDDGSAVLRWVTLFSLGHLYTASEIYLIGCCELSVSLKKVSYLRGCPSGGTIAAGLSIRMRDDPSALVAQAIVCK